MCCSNSRCGRIELIGHVSISRAVAVRMLWELWRTLHAASPPSLGGEVPAPPPTAHAEQPRAMEACFHSSTVNTQDFANLPVARFRNHSAPVRPYPSLQQFDGLPQELLHLRVSQALLQVGRPINHGRTR